MREEGFSFKPYWVKVSNIQFVADDDTLLASLLGNDSNLCRSIGATAKRYNPFDYYMSNVPTMAVKDILGSYNSDFKIHTLFASLAPENNHQIKSWCRYFGLPTYHIPDELDCKSDSEQIYLYDLDDLTDEFLHDKLQLLQYKQTLQDEIRLYKLAVQLSTLLYSNSVNSKSVTYTVDHETNEALIRYDLGICTGEDDAIYKQDECAYVLDEIITYHLRGIYPSFCNTSIVWRFDSLLAALYFMLAQDIDAKRPPRPCANHLCGSFFIPTREAAIYCSVECQVRAKQRRYKSKKLKRA